MILLQRSLSTNSPAVGTNESYQTMCNETRSYHTVLSAIPMLYHAILSAVYKYCIMLFCQPPVLSSWYSAILWSSHISCSSRWPQEPPIPWGLSVPIKIISLPMLTWAYSQQTGGRTLQGLMIMVNVCQAKVNIVEWWVTSQPNNSHVKLHIEWNNS